MYWGTTAPALDVFMRIRDLSHLSLIAIAPGYCRHKPLLLAQLWASLAYGRVRPFHISFH